MDRFTRNYSIILGIAVVALLVLFLFDDAQTRDLNDRLDADIALNSYPYDFRVLRVDNGVATMTTPRSADFPAYRALGLLFPDLAALPPEAPRLMEGQLEMARLQERARQIVTEAESVKYVQWELDRDWLGGHGITIGP